MCYEHAAAEADSSDDEGEFLFFVQYLLFLEATSSAAEPPKKKGRQAAHHVDTKLKLLFVDLHATLHHQTHTQTINHVHTNLPGFVDCLEISIVLRSVSI